MGYWRNLRCEGCWRECRYADFKTKGPDAFKRMVKDLKSSSPDPEDWRYRRKGTILGRLHAEKLEEWKHFTDNCPHWGEKEQPKFEVGDRVRWTYQKRTYTGTVKIIVPPGCAGSTLARGLKGLYRLSPSLYDERTRPRYSYIVAQTRPRRKVRLLWPSAELELAP